MQKSLQPASREYPSLLKEIPQPPAVLYYEGELDCLQEPAIAIVGSRHPSEYGRTVTLRLAKEIAERGIVVVSGFAQGIDLMAHQGALEGGGKTIAVLGAGLDIDYPRGDQVWRREIRQKGLLLTELPPGTPPLSHNFPLRNRIISGLSLGVVVVEAALNSGSLITAQWALEQNREIFAVPGPVDSPQSFGPHSLIQKGAKLVQRVEDILDEFPLFQVKQPQRDVERGDASPCGKPLYNHLKEEEKKILLQLTPTPKSVDEIMRRVNMESGAVLATLLSLELRGVIQQHPGKQFSILREGS